ncbi:hypothetical protein PESP_a1942 [Pseudoalteromonas espejiana DSM 9414]|nr:hypothetical protein PESP_a1942 [Pseudoalteromonas espejiana DSM 9414]
MYSLLIEYANTILNRYKAGHSGVFILAIALSIKIFSPNKTWDDNCS